ncbi:MAG: ATP-binding protein [Candidatus Paceibacterota bacterium]
MGRKPLKRIVITGGPCSGKSSTINELKRLMGERWHFVPEVSTILMNQVGIRPCEFLSPRQFQKAVRGIQIILEKATAEFAMAEGKEALIIDRGTMDNAVYLPGFVPEFEELFGTTSEREYSWYDLVICLDIPPEEIYNQMRSNNPARSEDYALAKEIAELTRVAWRGHTDFIFIENTFNWDRKLSNVIETIENFLKES